MNFVKQNLLWIITAAVILACLVLAFTVVQAKEKANSEQMKQYSSLGKKAEDLLRGDLYNKDNIADAQVFRTEFNAVRMECLADQRQRSEVLHTGYFMPENKGKRRLPDGHQFKLEYATKIEKLQEYAEEKLQIGKLINYFQSFGAAPPSDDQMRYYHTLYWFTRSLIDALADKRLEMGLSQVVAFSIGGRAGSGPGGGMMDMGMMGPGMMGPGMMGPGMMGPGMTGPGMTGPAGPRGRGAGVSSLLPPKKDGMRKYPFELKLVISSTRIPQMISAILSADQLFDIESIAFAATADPLLTSVPMPRVNVLVKGYAVDFDPAAPKKQK